MIALVNHAKLNYSMIIDKRKEIALTEIALTENYHWILFNFALKGSRNFFSNPGYAFQFVQAGILDTIQ